MILNTKNISLYYGKAMALNDVSLEISEGTVVTMIGANGSGKSSVMESICYAHYEKIIRKTANTDKVEKAGLAVVTKINGKY